MPSKGRSYEFTQYWIDFCNIYSMRLDHWCCVEILALTVEEDETLSFLHHRDHHSLGSKIYIHHVHSLFIFIIPCKCNTHFDSRIYLLGTYWEKKKVLRFYSAHVWHEYYSTTSTTVTFVFLVIALVSYIQLLRTNKQLILLTLA